MHLWRGVGGAGIGRPPGRHLGARPGRVAPHAHGQALLQAAVLAPVPVVLVDVAVLGEAALVPLVLPHGPLEEALAALADDHPIVAAAGAVAAHHTRLAPAGS